MDSPPSRPSVAAASTPSSAAKYREVRETVSSVLLRELDKLQAVEAAHEEELSRLSAERRGLESHLADLEAANGSLRTALDKASARLAETLDALEAARSDRDAAEGAIDGLQAELDDLRAAHADRVDLSDRLRAECDALEAARTEEAATNAALREKSQRLLRELVDKISALQSQVPALQDELAVEQGERQRLAHLLDSRTRELEARAADADAQLAAAQREIAGLNRDLEAARAEAEHGSARHSAEQSGLVAKVARLEGLLKAEKEKRMEAETRASFAATFERRGEDADRLRGAVADLESDNDRLNALLAAERRIRGELEGQVQGAEAAQDALTVLRVEHESLRERFDRLSRRSVDPATPPVTRLAPEIQAAHEVRLRVAEAKAAEAEARAAEAEERARRAESRSVTSPPVRRSSEAATARAEAAEREVADLRGRLEAESEIRAKLEAEAYERAMRKRHKKADKIRAFEAGDVDGGSGWNQRSQQRSPRRRSPAADTTPAATPASGSGFVSADPFDSPPPAGARSVSSSSFDDGKENEGGAPANSGSPVAYTTFEDTLRRLKAGEAGVGAGSGRVATRYATLNPYLDNDSSYSSEIAGGSGDAFAGLGVGVRGGTNDSGADASWLRDTPSPNGGGRLGGLDLNRNAENGAADKDWDRRKATEGKEKAKGRKRRKKSRKKKKKKKMKSTKKSKRRGGSSAWPAYSSSGSPSPNTMANIERRQIQWSSSVDVRVKSREESSDLFFDEGELRDLADRSDDSDELRALGRKQLIDFETEANTKANVQLNAPKVSGSPAVMGSDDGRDRSFLM